jgi:hypothetical protein
MGRRFIRDEDFRPVVGWRLYQVTLDKYAVMFYFESGWQLLNVAHSFSYIAADGSASYNYEIYGSNKFINVDRILRMRVARVLVLGKDRFALRFENGDDLIVHAEAGMCSWWFTPIADPEFPEKSKGWALRDWDDEID